jgi:ubiquinone/menaquinone biosynthesis C-methylase UbiE
MRDLDAVEVLPGLSASDYLRLCAESFPSLYRLLCASRASVSDIARLYGTLGTRSTHFESKISGGRGDSYREAQQHDYMYRNQGYLTLFGLATEHFLPQRESATILDAMGGDGTLTRIVQRERIATSPFIVTSDASAAMIQCAIAQGIPAVRQPLQELIWFSDCLFDAVIVAYGTHHIPPEERLPAVREAVRVLKPGGALVLHDFEIGRPTASWYSSVMDQATLTGHKFTHFTRQEMRELLSAAGLRHISVSDVYDPLVVKASSFDEARRLLLEYVFLMFGLEHMADESDGVLDEGALDKIELALRRTSKFDPDSLPVDARVSELTIAAVPGEYVAEVPRVALVARGFRSRGGA